MTLAVLAFIVGVAVVMGAFVALRRGPGMMLQRRLDQRLEEISAAPAKAQAPGASLVKGESGGALASLDRLLGGSERGSALAVWVEQSGVKTSVGTLLMIAAVLALVGAFAVTVVTRAPWAMPLGAAAGFGLPFLVLRIKRRRRLLTFEEQFPEALDLISRALKAGHAFATGLKMVADEMAEPVGPEFRKTFDEQNFGLPLKDALDNLSHRIPSLDVRFFSTAVLIQRETGGNLSEILENLSHVVRERFKILRQVRVYTAHGRLTGWVLLALPAFLAIALMFINPDHMNLLFREQMGRNMLMAALVMQLCGYVWIQKVIKIEV
ncbi:MAG TPA: type II secretion system F family protein [Burkholderiales bacterium]|nr:type II secretion system F family protein [Burkholderiales bacterium]